jgi:hypothetical protein
MVTSEENKSNQQFVLDSLVTGNKLSDNLVFPDYDSDTYKNKLHQIKENWETIPYGLEKLEFCSFHNKDLDKAIDMKLWDSIEIFGKYIDALFKKDKVDNFDIKPLLLEIIKGFELQQLIQHDIELKKEFSISIEKIAKYAFCQLLVILGIADYLQTSEDDYLSQNRDDQKYKLTLNGVKLIENIKEGLHLHNSDKSEININIKKLYMNKSNSDNVNVNSKFKDAFIKNSFNNKGEKFSILKMLSDHIFKVLGAIIVAIAVPILLSYF